MRRLTALLLLAVLAGCGGAVLPQIHDPANRLDVARRLYDKGDAALAIEVLAPFSTSGSGAADVDLAVYLLGLCKLRNKDHAGAQAEFERLLRDYPESDSAGPAEYRLGEALWGQSRGPDFDQEYTLKALDQWMKYRREYPGDEFGDAAQRRISEARARLATKLHKTGELYLKLQEHEAARSYFNDVLKQYSDTPVYPESRIGWAMATGFLGQRDVALAQLREVQQEYAGQPVAALAARRAVELEHWKAPRKPHKRRTAPNEPPPPGTQPGVNP